jgi:hypothetical protein
MNLFISNFRSEARVLLLVALVLSAGEIALRLVVERASIDVQRQRAFPVVAASLRSNRSGTVMFLGNSLTDRGVNLDTVTQSFRARGYVNIRAFKVHPDDSGLLDWYYTFKRFFLETGSPPDFVVVGYAGTQLDDTSPFHPERIARYSGLRYVKELFLNDLPNAGARIDYLVATTSVSIAEGGRARTAVLDALIPGYRSTAQLINAATRKQAASAIESTRGKTLGRLARFLAACREAQVIPVVVAMPVPYSYPVNPDVAAMVQASGGAFFDLRSISGLAVTDFPDGYHMDSRGAVIYSRELTQRLGDVLQTSNRISRLSAKDVSAKEAPAVETPATARSRD